MNYAESYSPLLLAYIGDAVFELYVRQKLATRQVLPRQQLHQQVTRIVRASGQAAALRQLEGHLSAEEAAVVRRGRNTKSHVPKNAEMSAYRHATGFEALLGWLYLSKQTERLYELLELIKIGEEEKR
ncbi:MAG TPA: Mini-ribonuclease 3 [Firmicutes bacterium]|jgi:ribonuclease-3 family protein|nr:Mini-ribonuclease 3 [Bacillota bacterium]HAA37551.1 Mini-ribonuclease 3 [Bacillota bacterium]